MRETFAKTCLISLTYYFATHCLKFFLYLFSLKILNKNIGCDGLITFWKKPNYPSLKSSLQPTISWILNFFGSKSFISKWGKKLFQSRAASANFYFKVGQAIFQKWGKICLSWAIVLLKRGSYFKFGQLFQSETYPDNCLPDKVFLYFIEVMDSKSFYTRQDILYLKKLIFWKLQSFLQLWSV